MSTPILVLQHASDTGLGHLGGVLSEAGMAVETVRFDRGGTLPAGNDYRAVVSLGGHMGAYEVDRYPWLVDEKRYLADAVHATVPVLGICLGCQLLADALGGRAYLAETPEVAVAPVTPTAVGRADAVIRLLGGRFVIWHQDTWDLPPRAELLAVTDRYPQAFRLGSALGLQPHPEVTSAMARSWASTGRLVTIAGHDPDEFVARVEEEMDAIERRARGLFIAWVESL